MHVCAVIKACYFPPTRWKRDSWAGYILYFHLRHTCTLITLAVKKEAYGKLDLNCTEKCPTFFFLGFTLSPTLESSGRFHIYILSWVKGTDCNAIYHKAHQQAHNIHSLHSDSGSEKAACKHIRGHFHTHHCTSGHFFWRRNLLQTEPQKVARQCWVWHVQTARVFLVTAWLLSVTCANHRHFNTY